MGNYLSYGGIRIGIFLIGLLPMPIIHFLSTGISFLLSKIIKYRKKIIDKNLKLSFPSASNENLNTVRITFYNYFSDLIMETIKGFSMSLESLTERVVDKEPEIMQDIFKKNKKVLMVMGHYGNFEWLCRALPVIIPNCEHICLYQPVKNKLLDDFVKKDREKYGMKMISVKDMKALIAIAQTDTRQCFWFVMDQVPGAPHESAHWMQFLNQDTPVIMGPEKFAKRIKAAVVYTELQRKTRGYYTLHHSLITENADNNPAFEITEKEMYCLEKGIKKQPELWLWSHNRWKHHRMLPS